MHVLSEQDQQFWNRNGYVIVSQAVPQENLEAVIQAIWDFRGLSPADVDSWYEEPPDYREPELQRSGMVELYHHQALWDNRQHPRVYGAFADIRETEKLWVTFDRVNMNLPIKSGWKFEGFIHWDIDTSQDPLPYDVQGVLSLVDTPKGMGGFQCVPGFHRKIETWIQEQPDDRDPFIPDLTGLEVKSVPTKAGDLLIWNSRLPHGTSVNLSGRIRFAQYISMFPADEENEEHRRQRIESWKNRTTPRDPQGFPFPGDPRKREQRHGCTACLTELGEKLLGLKSWEE